MSDERKQRVIELVRATHADADAFFRGLPTDVLERPVYEEGEGWRVRDLIAHIALWQSVSTRVAEKIAATDTLPDTPDWDVWAGELTPTPELNERCFEEWRGRSVADSLAHLATTNARLIAALERLRDDQLAAGDRLPDEMHAYVRVPGVRHPRTHRTHVASALEDGPLTAAKRAALGSFERTYHEIEVKLQGLSAAQLERPVFTGEGDGWRVRDLIPHLARWQRMAAQAARLIAGGSEPAPEMDFKLRQFVGLSDSVDEVNDRAYAEWRDRPVADQLAELSAAHTALMDALRVLPAARVVKDDGEPYRYFWQPGLNHLHQHWAHIEDALKESHRP
ncbi:MAG: maleylpyruvate isomerase N-terminal domain-containing protein [Chloroflexota bacterium]|nr:maleylpyruvate isomerase N-terminal domain-containing protein [Chloroflexota bacterium]